MENEGGRDDRGLDSTSGSGLGQGRKNGNVRKIGSRAERRDWVRSYWNSISLDRKKELLRIRVSDIKSHYGLSKDGLANEVLAEALSFAEASKAGSSGFVAGVVRSLRIRSLICSMLCRSTWQTSCPKCRRFCLRMSIMNGMRCFLIVHGSRWMSQLQ